jgi:16S rRNA (uracil1498-N3)-methyltransferase
VSKHGSMNEGDLVLPVSSLPRTRFGDIVTVETGGVEYRARITGIDNGKATLHLFEQLKLPSESTLEITLIQALPKKERMELIIQKATELGVAAILPCRSVRSITLAEREAHQIKAHRWAAIAAKAAEQSRRRLVPHIADNVDLPAALKSASGAELKLILYEKEVRLNLHELTDRSARSLAIAAGPEGGFTEDEVLLAQSCGYLPVRLGGRVLRCETASIAALSIAQFLWGDL